MYGFSKCKAEKGVSSEFSNPHFTRDHIAYSSIKKKSTKVAEEAPSASKPE